MPGNYKPLSQAELCMRQLVGCKAHPLGTPTRTHPFSLPSCDVFQSMCPAQPGTLSSRYSPTRSAP